MRDPGRWLSRYHAYLWLLDRKTPAGFAEMYLDSARDHGQAESAASGGVEVSYDADRDQFFVQAT